MPSQTTISKIATKIRDLLIIATLASSILGAVGLTVWKANKEDIRSASREFLGVNELATKDQLKEIIDAIKELTGADRIIHRDPVFSYVKEPVRLGEDLTARYLVNRTALGAECVAKSAIPLFTDERNISMPGLMLSPLRQFSETPTPVEIKLEQPFELTPGRVCVTIAISYSCNDKPVFDQLDPICYILQS